jgi:hypothetical protein
MSSKKPELNIVDGKVVWLETFYKQGLDAIVSGDYVVNAYSGKHSKLFFYVAYLSNGAALKSISDIRFGHVDDAKKFCEQHAGFASRSNEVPPADTSDPLQRQVGGSHYKDMAIQPVEYILKNGIGFVEGSVIAYVSRWKSKGGVEDLKKARHLLDILINHEEE